MKSPYWAKILFVVLAAVPATAQVATNDLFNRPDSNSLGADWAEQDGDSKIMSNKLQVNSPFGFGWCSHNGFQVYYAAVVVRAHYSTNGPGGDSISLLSGVEPNSWSGIEVRIADNDGDGASDRIFFNASVNAGAWYAGGGPSFVNMTTPMTSGEITTWYSNGGDTVNVSLKDDITQAVQTYSASGILANPPIGNSVGIGYFGNGSVDDFRAWVGNTTQPVYSLSEIHGGGSTSLLVTGAQPNSNIAIAYSTAGVGPIPTPFGILGLSSPIEILLETPADATGRLEIVFGLGPMVGLPVHTQAFDVAGLALTNYFTVTL